ARTHAKLREKISNHQILTIHDSKKSTKPKNADQHRLSHLRNVVGRSEVTGLCRRGRNLLLQGMRRGKNMQLPYQTRRTEEGGKSTRRTWPAKSRKLIPRQKLQ